MIQPKILNYYLCLLFPQNTLFKLIRENLSA